VGRVGGRVVAKLERKRFLFVLKVIESFMGETRHLTAINTQVGQFGGGKGDYPVE